MTMGDRVAVLRAGILELCDTPLRLYQEPANVFVAGFIGSPGMNIADFRWRTGTRVLGRARLPLTTRRDRLMANAGRQREDPLAFLADRDLFGDLVEDDRFTAPYLATLASLHERGARVTLEELVQGRQPTR